MTEVQKIDQLIMDLINESTSLKNALQNSTGPSEAEKLIINAATTAKFTLSQQQVKTWLMAQISLSDELSDDQLQHVSAAGWTDDVKKFMQDSATFVGDLHVKPYTEVKKIFSWLP